MGKTVTSRYDVAQHLRTPEEMAAYLEACLEEADVNNASGIDIADITYLVNYMFKGGPVLLCP